MSQFGASRFNILPPVVKNLIIINGLMFLATITLQQFNLTRLLGLYYFDSVHFKPFQIVTHMFMHGSFMHIAMNMFVLWMFGSVLENIWGPKKFLLFYLITGLGAAAMHIGVNAFQVYSIVDAFTLDGITTAVSRADESTLKGIYQYPTVGASGAVFGLLMAFGMTFPNSLIYLYFLFPLKAKYFVGLLIIIELYMGINNNPGDNIAHFAHLGGALFGYILIKIWNSKSKTFF